jgi:hypothetical protein
MGFHQSSSVGFYKEVSVRIMCVVNAVRNSIKRNNKVPKRQISNGGEMLIIFEREKNENDKIEDPL